MVRDLGSLNGTYLNGEKIGQLDWLDKGEAITTQTPQMSLREGDELHLGSHVFRVTLEVVDSPEFAEGARPVESELCVGCA